MAPFSSAAFAAEIGSPIVIACLNNSGWTSIRDFQRGMFGEDRAFSVRFTEPGGEERAVDFLSVATGMGCDGERVSEPEQVAGAIERGIASGGPYVIDIALSTDPADTEGINVGHWDLPKPAYLEGSGAAAT